MSEIHEVVEEAEGKYLVKYKRTLKDIDGNDVVISDGAHRATEAEITAEIQNWEGQKINCDNQIAKLLDELKEIEKIKK